MKKCAAVSLSALLAAAGICANAESAAAQAKKKAPAAEAPLPMMDKERIRAHVKYLSSDELEGRGTGQRGGDLAAGLKRAPRSQWSRPGRDSQTTLVARDRYASSHV